MGRQYFRTQIGEAPAVSQTQVAAAATDTILWDPAGLASNTAIAANAIGVGQTFHLNAWGTETTAVTGSQTLTVTPRFGTTVSGTTLGASLASPIHAVATTRPWYLEMWVTFRKIGTAGEAVCGGVLHSNCVVGTAATTNYSPLTFGLTGTTATAVNTTVAAGLLLSVNANLSTHTFNCLEVIMETSN